MKKVILSDHRPEYSDAELLQLIPDHKFQILDDDPRTHAVYEDDSDFFESFCTSLEVVGWDEKDRSVKGEVRIYVPMNKSTVKGFRQKLQCPLTEIKVNAAVELLKDEIRTYLTNKFEDQKEKQYHKDNGLTKISAQALLHKLLKLKFGITPIFTVASSSKSYYRISDFPIDDIDIFDQDLREYNNFKKEVNDYLDDIESNYGITIRRSMPSKLASTWDDWTFWTTGPKFLWDKKTKTATEYIPE